MLTAVSIISTFTVESNLAISREVEEVYISEILLHTYPRSCTQMFIALLFLTAKTRNKLGVQHNGQIVIQSYTGIPCIVNNEWTKINLKNYLSEKSQFAKQYTVYMGFLGGTCGKNPPAKAEEIRSPGKSPGGGHGNPLQCSCLESPMDRGAWQATVHRGTQSQTKLK